MFYSFCWWLCMIWIRVMYHVEIVGRENVPRDRGYILAANHRTNTVSYTHLDVYKRQM